jgi:hypothetical protein
MAKTISYDPALNRIYAKGGTEMDPITFNDLYNADQGGGWGVVHYHGDNVYALDALLYLGDGSTSTYFIDSRKVVVFTDQITGNSVRLIYVYNNAHIQLGKVAEEDEKSTYDGCEIFINMSADYSMLLEGQTTNTYRRLYGCTISTPSNYIKRCQIYSYSDTRLWNCNFVNFTFPEILGNANIYNATVMGGWDDPYKGRAIEGQFGSPVIDKVFATNMGWFAQLMPWNNEIKIDNVVTDNEKGVYINQHNKDIILTDCFLTDWTMWMQGEDETGKVLRKYTVNIHVADKDGNDLEGATIVCKDKNGNEVFNVQTDSYGNITEQEVTYQQWYQLSWGEHGEEDAICYSPHSFEISQDEKESLIYENITLDKPINWHVELQEEVQYQQQEIPGLEKVYVGDMGTVFEIDVGLDISSWTNLKMKVKKGDGSEAVWDAHVKPGGGKNNYIMRYISSKVTSDFTCDGIYYITPYGESGDWKGHGRTVSFFVYLVYE